MYFNSKSKGSCEDKSSRISREIGDEPEPFLVDFTFVYPGVNACVFAYGQTGSGKTYSMVGDILQQGTGQAESVSATTTNSTGTSSGGNGSPYKPENGGTAKVTGEETTTNAGRHSPQDTRGTAVLAGERAGIIPRAVEEIFRSVRQGGIGEGTPSLFTCGRRSPCSASSRGGSRGLQNDSPAAAAAPASAGGGDGPASASRNSTASSCQSSCSSRSSSSDDLPFAQVPSAAHWPLGEPTVYVPRSGSPKDPTLNLARHVLPPHDQKTCAAVGREEGDGDKDILKTCQDACAVESTTRSKCSVECSYMQVCQRFKKGTRNAGLLVLLLVREWRDG